MTEKIIFHIYNKFGWIIVTFKVGFLTKKDTYLCYLVCETQQKYDGKFYIYINKKPLSISKSI